MTDIIPRLREGEGADRELDALVMLHLGAATAINPKAAHRIRFSPKMYPEESDEFFCLSPSLTSSLEACIALAERALPGIMWRVEKAPLPCVTLWFPDGEAVEGLHASSLARAFATALITAKEARP